MSDDKWLGKETGIPADLWAVLGSRFSPARQQKMRDVAAKRSNKLRLVAQDLENAHNISACLRSAEAFGLMAVDVIGSAKFKPSTVARGVSQWLDVFPHTSIETCARQLKDQGYKIVAAMPAQNATPLEALEITQPTAILLGNEHKGVSSAWAEYVDTYYCIPMTGMVESLNVSVCAAISLWHLTQKASAHFGSDYCLDAGTQEKLLSRWVSRLAPHWKSEYQHNRQSI